MKYVWHIVRYVIVFIINLLILLFVHSYFNLVIMIIMLVFPVVSMVCAVITSRHLTVAFGGCSTSLTVDEPFLISVILDNKSYIPNMNVDIVITMSNDLFKTRGTHTLCIPAYSHNSDVVDYQIGQSLTGVLKVMADAVYVTDWMGVIRLKSKCHAVGEYVVYPSGNVQIEPEMSALAQGMTESEENRKKGYDFSEVVDVREYQPGDRLQNIHWKLSAKNDMLMVKDRESMSSSNLIVVVELVNDETNILNDILKAAYGLGVYLLKEQIPYTYCIWSDKIQDAVAMPVDSMDDLRNWMELIFYENAYEDEGHGMDMISRVMGADKRILVITKSSEFHGEKVFDYGSRVEGYISD